MTDESDFPVSEPAFQAEGPIGPGDFVAIATELERAAGLVAAARRLLAEGELADLSALTPRVEAVCDAATRLPPEQGDALLPGMEALIHDLDALEADLRESFAGVVADPAAEDRAAAARAATAYRRDR